MGGWEEMDPPPHTPDTPSSAEERTRIGGRDLR